MLKLWKRENGNKNGWKTFVVKFRDHVGHYPTVAAIVKARSESEAIEKALPECKKLNRDIRLYIACPECGFDLWRGRAYSPDIEGDYSSIQEYLEDIQGLREHMVNGVLAIGTQENG